MTTSTVSENLARALVEGLRQQMDRRPYDDIKVKVENQTFYCHKFMLSACSQYFRREFEQDRSDVIKLSNISAETFGLIIKSIYFAENVINDENVSQIWFAASKLEIPSLLESCERFQCDRMCRKNCVDIYLDSKKTHSGEVRELAYRRIIEEFNYLMTGDRLLNLDFDDLKSLLNNKNLPVASEDALIDVILRWVVFNPQTVERSDSEAEVREDANPRARNQRRVRSRQHLLPDLLQNCKLCLASGVCLQQLLDNLLVRELPAAFSMVRDALRYHLDPARRHDYCPPSAIHRPYSSFQNVILIGVTKFGKPGLSFWTPDDEWIEIKTYEAPLHKAVSFGDHVIVTTTTGRADMYDTLNHTWNKLPTLGQQGDNYDIVCHGNYLFFIGGEGCTSVKKLCLKDELLRSGSARWKKVGDLPNNVCKIMTTTIGNNIVIFGKDYNEGISVIQSVNVSTTAVRSFANQSLPVDHSLVSFKYKDETFVIQQNGKLWKIVSCDTALSMEFRGDLWQTPFETKAAIISNDELLVVGEDINDNMLKEWDTPESEMFSRVKIVECTTNFLINGVIKKEHFLHQGDGMGGTLGAD
ncbi:kelch-like protein 24 [Physella acuta]|uniref:kelch-like protein 24 n=1 Tax=Physella acuta TaxID=109671 RepID=UPI0027DB88C7|nr:kelch-like protein 24 [Physella acuta]